MLFSIAPEVEDKVEQSAYVTVREKEDLERRML
jgi:hypothetical protein